MLGGVNAGLEWLEDEFNVCGDAFSECIFSLPPLTTGETSMSKLFNMVLSSCRELVLLVSVESKAVLRDTFSGCWSFLGVLFDL